MPQMTTTPVDIKIGAQDNATATLNRLSNVLERLERKVEKTGQTTKKLTSRFDRLRMSMSRVGQTSRRLGSRMTQAFTLPALAAGGFAVNAFRKYEKGLVGIGKTTGISGKSLDDLGLRFRQIAKDIPISLEQLLAFGQTVGQLGIDNADDVAKFAEVFGKLQLATDIQGEDGVQQLGNILRQIEGGVGNVERFASALVHVGNTSGATESQILSMATGIANAGKSFGFNSPQVIALSAVLREAGQRAEASQGVIQRAMLHIQNSINEGGAAFNGLQILTGKSADALKKDFADNAAGVLAQFSKGVKKANDAGLNIVEMLKMFKLSGTEDIRVLLAMGQNYDRLNEKLKTASGSYNFLSGSMNALNKEVEVQQKTLDSKIKKTLARINDLAISIGKKLQPTILKILQHVEKLFIFFERNETITKVSMAIVGLAAVLGPLAMIFGSVASGLGSMVAVAAKLGPLLKVVRSVFGVIFGVAGAKIAAIAAIAALIGMIGVAIYDWKLFKELVDKGFSMIGIENFTQKVAALWADFTEKLGMSIYKTLGEEFSAFVGLDVEHYKKKFAELEALNKKKLMPEILQKTFEKQTPESKAINEKLKRSFNFKFDGDKLKGMSKEQLRSLPGMPKPSEQKTEIEKKQTAQIQVDFRNLPQGARVSAPKQSLDGLEIITGMQGVMA
jgi:TP901 family phage tail tape measure protein